MDLVTILTAATAVTSALSAGLGVAVSRLKKRGSAAHERGRQQQRRTLTELQHIGGILGSVRVALLRAEWQHSVMTSTLVAEATALPPVGAGWSGQWPGRDYEEMVRGLRPGEPHKLVTGMVGEALLVPVFQAAEVRHALVWLVDRNGTTYYVSAHIAHDEELTFQQIASVCSRLGALKVVLRG